MYKYNKCLENRGLKGKMKTLKIVLFSVLSILLTVALISSASAISDSKTEKLLFVSLNYKDSKITVNDISWSKGFYSEPYISPRISLEEAEIKIFDNKENLMHESKFYIENKRTFDRLDEETGELSGGTIDLNDVNFSVMLPYLDNMGSIEIYSNYNDIILQKSEMKINEMKIPTVSGSACSDSECQLNCSGSDCNTVDDKPEKETEDNTKTEEKSEEKTPFLLNLIGIFDNIYKYIFG
jgi:hypothetical protein